VSSNIQARKKEPFDFRVIRFEEPGHTIEYNYMQTMALCAAYIAGINKEA
jgi:hypothetical protein